MIMSSSNVMSDRIAILILLATDTSCFTRGYPPSGFLNMLQQPQFPPPAAGEKFHFVGVPENFAPACQHHHFPKGLQHHRHNQTNKVHQKGEEM
jgi:hypothetical protein